MLHVGSMSRGTLQNGAVISAEVDHVRRGRIVPNHTFTHVLNYALREVRRSCGSDTEGCATPFTPLSVSLMELVCISGKAGFLQVLGDHVDQKGSIVQPDRLRFDFSHSGPIDGPTLGQIENICNEQLAKKMKIYAKDCALADARQINGRSAA